MNVKFIDNFETVGEQAWNALAAKSPTDTIFQTWAWQRAWWRSHGAGRTLRLVTVYDGADLCVLMPLFLEARVLRFIGHGSADRLDLIYDAGRSADLLALLMPLKARHDWDEVELAAVPDASPTWRYLRLMADEAGLFPLSMGKCPQWGVQLEGREDRVRRSLHTGVLAKHASILGLKGRVLAVHEQAPKAEALPWKVLFTQHIHRWAGRGKPSLFVARQERDFFRAMAEDPSLNPAMVFTVLDLDGRPAGYHVGFIHQQVFYACVFSFDIALKRFSPDDVLWREMTAYALVHGCRQITFVSSEESAVKHFADRTGAAQTIRLLRHRRMAWVAKSSRWIGKVPFMAATSVILKALGEVFVTFFQSRKIVAQARQHVGVLADTGPWMITRPEIELCRRLRLEMKDIRMLDIGIGYGRTSIYFAPVVKQYHGFDHGPDVVAAVKADLGDQVSPDDVFVADACCMGFAPGGVYDLVLLSGDGLDGVSTDDRIRILKEVRRVGREGAWFCFSSRNLQSLRPGAGFGVVDFLRRLRQRILMAEANPGLGRLCHHAGAVLVDEQGGYQRPFHYVTPKEQVRVLKDLGFHDVRVLSTRSGLEVRDWRRWDKLVDRTLYYLCRV